MEKPWLEYHQDLQQICEPLFRKNIVYFAHQYIQSNGSYFVLANDPSASEYYFSELGCPPAGLTNFHELKTGTIVLHEHNDRAVGFTSGTLMQLREGFNIIHPISFIQKHATFAEMFVFGLDSVESYAKFMTDSEFIQKFLFYYKDRAKDIINRAKILMPVAKIPEDFILEPNHDENAANKISIDTYWLTTERGEVSLNKTQYDVLVRIGRGLEAKEIAKELNKSESRTKHIINEIRFITGFSRKSDLRKLYAQNHIILP